MTVTYGKLWRNSCFSCYSCLYLQMSPDVSLPQFDVLGHRQRIIEASLSSGNYSRWILKIPLQLVLPLLLFLSSCLTGNLKTSTPHFSVSDDSAGAVVKRQWQDKSWWECNYDGDKDNHWCLFSDEDGANVPNGGKTRDRVPAKGRDTAFKFFLSKGSTYLCYKIQKLCSRAKQNFQGSFKTGINFLYIFTECYARRRKKENTQLIQGFNISNPSQN